MTPVHPRFAARPMPEPQLSDPAVWQETSFRLVYRLGTVTLLTRQFRALVLRRHFLDLSADPLQPHPPLSRLGKDLDVIVTRSHPVDAPLPTFCFSGGALRYVMSQYRRQYVLLTGTFENYLARFSGKTRATLRRKVKRFLAHGTGCEMREYKHPGDIAHFYARARTVSALTYQERLLDAGLPDRTGFLEELIDIASRDRVRGYLLMLHERPIAYLCCLSVDDILLYSYVGYDPGYAELSPGTVLQYLVLESLFKEQSFRAFDFTEGEGEHKRLFGTNEALCADIGYFRPTATVQACLGVHACVEFLSVRIGRGLERLGWKSAVKRLIRRAC